MSRKYSKLSNKNQKRPRVHYQQYLYNASEPFEHISYSSLDDLDVDLLDNSDSMRQGFRQLASKLRK